MTFRKEVNFILKRYFTNGFTIWAFFILITYQIRTVPIISEFRTSLWLDQLMWVFFVPLFIQVILDVATRIKIVRKFHWFSKWMIFYVVAGSGLGWVLIIDFAFFSGGILLLIGEYQDGIAIANLEKYTFMNNLSTLSGIFIIPIFSITIIRITSYLVDKKIIIEKKFTWLSVPNKTSIFCMSFSLSLCVFVIYHEILKSYL